MEKRHKIYVYLKELLIKRGFLTNWGWNDDFLNFWDMFYPEYKEIKAVQRKFRYHANKLVRDRLASKAKRVGIGLDGYFEYGTRTQTIWSWSVGFKKD